MREERLEVSVTFDERHGYVASAPELRSAIVALILGGLRRKVEIALLPDDVRVVLHLDGLADVRPPRRKSGFEPEPDMSTQQCSEEFTVKEGDPRGITFSFDFDVRDCSDGAEHY